MAITTFELEDARRLAEDAVRLGFAVSRRDRTVRALMGETLQEKLDAQAAFRSLASRYYHTRTPTEDAGYFVSRGVGERTGAPDGRTGA